ncbi:MAG: AfsR/SARP family transcriptional regulator [Mycobacteriales bacterium]
MDGDHTLRYRILGPVDALSGGRRVAMPGPKVRTLLALLVVNANQTVSVDTLLDELWPSGAPASGPKLVQIYVSQLRRTLGDRKALLTTAPGYQLVARPGETDLHHFHRLRAAGRQALAAGDDAAAASSLEAALALWRGGALADVTGSPALRAVAGRLEELRALARESWIDARFGLGQHAELAADLRALVSQQPLREELWIRLMTALQGAGRQAEALAAYTEARRALIDGAGVEPGEELRRTHSAVLAGAPIDTTTAGRVQPAPAPATVCQLPHDLPDFVGRAAELEAAAARLAAGPTALVVTGKPGVGKSGLAVRLAHQLRDGYPDGQLYAKLRTAAGTPAEAAEVLGSFLRALGVPAPAWPAGLEERAQLYRERLADRRVLVVLDDAASEGQVRPLIPGTAGSGAVVTSQARLAGLEGAAVLELDVLPPAAARTLLGEVAGGDRVIAEAGEADRLADLCGRLPLALRIAGARLAARPDWTVRRLADALASERGRLDELSAGDLEVRAVLRLSYQRLPADTRRVWRLLGVPDTQDFPTWWVCALLGCDEAAADRVIGQLLDAHLLELAAPDRYRFHELSRLYARERANEEETPRARARVLTTLVEAYRAATRLADDQLGDSFLGAVLPAAAGPAAPPGPAAAIAAAPLAWLEAERGTVLALIDQVAAAGPVDAQLWQLAASLHTFLEVRGHLDDWRRSHLLALPGAGALGSAVLQRGLGEIHTVQDRYDHAVDCFDASAKGFAALGEPTGEAAALSGLGLLHRLRGRHDAAVAAFTRSLALCRRSGNPRGEAYARSGLAVVDLEKGRLAAAASAAGEALALARRASYPSGAAAALRTLALVHRAHGRLAEAGAALEEATELAAGLGDRACQAHAQQWLALVAGQRGDTALAASLLERCVTTYADLGNRFGQALTLRNAAELSVVTGALDLATSQVEDSLAVWREIRCPYWSARTLDTRAALADRAGDPATAERVRVEARALRRKAGLPEPAPGGPDPYRGLTARP